MDQFQKGLHQLLEVLPPVVREKLESHPDLTSLVEVVMDYGRPAEVRFLKSVERWPGTTISEHEIEHVVKAIGEFGEDNRAGIERTLHRISAIRNRHDKVIGLTCRVGRALEGTIDIIDDIVRSGNSILILGKPGVGKTTKLREVARVLADEVTKRVVIVDTSNEIGGDGDIPHPAIGSARRMQVTKPAYQHQTMIEAVENHMPEVIVIDEIGNEQEALAARTIAERGVQLIGTAHGGSLENLMLNPSLCDLIGGIQAVTLSDDEAKRRGTQKTVLERKAPPTFDVVIELIDFDRLAVHHNVQKTVDLMLRGISPRPEIRVKTDLGKVEVLQKEESVELKEPGFNQRFPALAKTQEENKQSRAEKQANSRRNVVKIFPYGVARTRLERAIREKKAPAYITTDANQADVVIAIRTVHQSSANKLKDIKRSIPIITVKSNTFTQIAQAVEQAVKSSKTKSDEMQQAMMEAQKAADEVMQTGQAVELAPQDAKTRKKQHKIVESKRLATEAIGQEPKRRVKILPTRSV